jgi:DNA-binding CsgD family transcriptional regulator
MEELARHFGKTVPTIRQALRHGKAKDPLLRGLPTTMPRRRWEVDHAAEVAQLRAEGKTFKELVSRFGKSEPTIRKALQYAAACGIALTGKGADQADQA